MLKKCIKKRRVVINGHVIGTWRRRTHPRHTSERVRSTTSDSSEFFLLKTLIYDQLPFSVVSREIFYCCSIKRNEASLAMQVVRIADWCYGALCVIERGSVRAHIHSFFITTKSPWNCELCNWPRLSRESLMINSSRTKTATTMINIYANDTRDDEI